MLPLRSPIKVTLFKLRLSAYRNFNALLYHHRYDLHLFFTAYHNYFETASCTIPQFQFNSYAVHLKTKLDIISTPDRATWEVLKSGAAEGLR